MARSTRKAQPYNPSKIKTKNNVLLITSEGYETREAPIEKGKLAELVIEREADKGIIGNIFKGRVDRIVSGIGAAFVDIGVHQDGLVHISQLVENKFVNHPLDIVSVGDIVEVKVIDVDVERRRIQLSMII